MQGKKRDHNRVNFVLAFFQGTHGPLPGQMLEVLTILSTVCFNAFHFDSHIDIGPVSAGSVTYTVNSFFFKAFYFDSHIEIEPLSNPLQPASKTRSLFP